MSASLPHSQHEPADEKPPRLDGFVAHGALHEVFAARPADAAAATCFALGLLKPRRLFWLRQELVQVESGALYAPGLATLGLDPAQVVIVTLRDALSVLQAGLEVARTRGLPAGIIELWGAAKPYTLTASRKLVLAAKASGITLCMINHAVEPAPSAAETRWQVKRLPSQNLAGQAPGIPALEATLLRHRSNARAGQVWSVEWNNEKRCFETRGQASFASTPPLPEPVVSLPAIRKTPLHKAA